MSLNGSELEKLIFGTPRLRRFTQDSPVLPDVWLAYEDPDKAVDLLLTPYRDGNPAELYRALRARLPRRADRGLTYNESYVVVRLTFAELIRCALPLTKWWSRYVWPEARRATGPRAPEAEKPVAPVEEGLPSSPPADPRLVLRERIRRLQDPRTRKDIVDRLARRRGEDSGEKPAPGRAPRRGTADERAADLNPSGDLLWMVEIVGALAAAAGPDEVVPGAAAIVRSFQKLIRGMELDELPEEPLLWAVHRNRKATNAVWKSTLACKADAARLLFQISCKDLRWAVIDSGIDATHPVFRRRNPKNGRMYHEWLGSAGESRTRIVETYDFTRLRALLDPEKPEPEDEPDDKPAGGRKVLRFNAADRKRLKQVRTGIEEGRMLDWNYLAELIRVPLDERYGDPDDGRLPGNPHGTHVAGVLAGDWKVAEGLPDTHDLLGMCPDLELYDLRVLDERGESDEFTVLAALQFVRHLNSNKAKPVVHGINMSLSLYHNVMNYACGRTPVCEECHRVIATGAVVVAAAGNEGHASFLTSKGSSEGYRASSITDPGNADGVITVGATHRNRAFTYGVSYFSSRGPTGDGRVKPDLVAPGEKITSAIPGADLDTLDGTSMAAPHVSGAAALLMARHEELMGDPQRIKQILCDTATDLGRERFFQGRGMLDVLRALQSV